MVVVGKIMLGDVGRHNIRYRDAVREFAIQGGRPREGTNGLRVDNEPGDFFTNMACFFNTVVNGDQGGGADKQVQKRRFVGYGGKPMEFHERVGQHPGKIPFTGQEYAFVGNEHIVEYRQRFNQMVFRTDGMVIHTVARKTVGAGNEFNAGGIHRDRKGHSVVLILFGERPGGQHNHLIHEDGSGGMRFGATHNDTVRSAFDDMDVVVGMRLL